MKQSEVFRDFEWTIEPEQNSGSADTHSLGEPGNDWHQQFRGGVGQLRSMMLSQPIAGISKALHLWRHFEGHLDSITGFGSGKYRRQIQRTESELRQTLGHDHPW